MLLRMRSENVLYEVLDPHGEERGDAARLEPMKAELPPTDPRPT